MGIDALRQFINYVAEKKDEYVISINDKANEEVIKQIKAACKTFGDVIEDGTYWEVRIKKWNNTPTSLKTAYIARQTISSASLAAALLGLGAPVTVPLTCAGGLAKGAEFYSQRNAKIQAERKEKNEEQELLSAWYDDRATIQQCAVIILKRDKYPAIRKKDAAQKMRNILTHSTLKDIHSLSDNQLDVICRECGDRRGVMSFLEQPNIADDQRNKFLQALFRPAMHMIKPELLRAVFSYLKKATPTSAIKTILEARMNCVNFSILESDLVVPLLEIMLIYTLKIHNEVSLTEEVVKKSIVTDRDLSCFVEAIILSRKLKLREEIAKLFSEQTKLEYEEYILAHGEIAPTFPDLHVLVLACIFLFPEYCACSVSRMYRIGPKNFCHEAIRDTSESIKGVFLMIQMCFAWASFQAISSCKKIHERVCLPNRNPYLEARRVKLAQIKTKLIDVRNQLKNKRDLLDEKNFEEEKQKLKMKFQVSVKFSV